MYLTLALVSVVGGATPWAFSFNCPAHGVSVLTQDILNWKHAIP